jgi:hypothetical protein
MENNCAFANLEDKYTFKLDKMAIARWMCRTLPIQGRIARVSFRLHSHRMYTQLQILDLFSIVIFHRYSVIDIERNLRRQEDKYKYKSGSRSLHWTLFTNTCLAPPILRAIHVLSKYLHFFLYKP